MNGIFRQPVRVVGIGITAGNAVHALPQQFRDLVINLTRLPLIGQAGGHPFRQPITPVRRFQQKGASVGTALPLIELDHDWLGKKIGKQQTLCCGMFSQAKASVVAFKHCIDNMFVAQEAFRVCEKTRIRELSGLVRKEKTGHHRY